MLLIDKFKQLPPQLQRYIGVLVALECWVIYQLCKGGMWGVTPLFLFFEILLSITVIVALVYKNKTVAFVWFVASVLMLFNGVLELITMLVEIPKYSLELWKVFRASFMLAFPIWTIMVLVNKNVRESFGIVIPLKK